MNFEDFDELLERRIAKIRETLSSKSKEYSRGQDKLHNFKAAGRRDGVSAVQALRGMDLKHRQSLADIVEDYIKNGVVPEKKLLDEKLVDYINYAILLEALFEDMREEPKALSAPKLIPPDMRELRKLVFAPTLVEGLNTPGIQGRKFFIYVPDNVNIEPGDKLLCTRNNDELYVHETMPSNVRRDTLNVYVSYITRDMNAYVAPEFFNGSTMYITLWTVKKADRRDDEHRL